MSCQKSHPYLSISGYIILYHSISFYIILYLWQILAKLPPVQWLIWFPILGSLFFYTTSDPALVACLCFTPKLWVLAMFTSVVVILGSAASETTTLAPKNCGYTSVTVAIRTRNRHWITQYMTWNEQEFGCVCPIFRHTIMNLQLQLSLRQTICQFCQTNQTNECW